MFLESLALIVTTVVLLAVSRFCFLANRITKGNGYVGKRTEPCRTLVVMGSGGHTSEMLRIISGLKLKNYNPRLYVAAHGDEMSQDKVRFMELSWKKEMDSQGTMPSTFHIKTIPRARKVMQSYFTSIFTTLIAIAYSFSLVLSFSPELLLCNGPGTCLPVCFWAYIFKFIGWRSPRIVYVESLCRVKQFSLSGSLLYYLCVADIVYVQWSKMKKQYPRATYIGRIV